MNIVTSSEYQLNRRTFRLVSYSLIALMIVAASATLAEFAYYLSTNSYLRLLPLFCLLVILDRLFLFQQFKKLPVGSGEYWLRILSQWVVIIFVVKIGVVLLTVGWRGVPAELLSWRIDFLGNFFDLFFLIACGFVFVIWLLVGGIAGLIDEIIEEIELPNLYRIVSAPDDRITARERLINLVIGLGFILVVLTGLMRVDVRAILTGEGTLGQSHLSFWDAGGLSTFIYFVLALALFSQIRFIHQYIRWRAGRMHVAQDMARNWVRFTLIFLFLLAGLTLLLPTNYTFGLLRVIANILQIIFQFLFAIFQFIWFLIAFIFSLPFSIIKSEQIPESAVPEVPQFEFEPRPIIDMSSPAWIEGAKSLLFWVLIAGVFVFAFIQYLRQHEGLADHLKKFSLVRVLYAAWKWIRGLFGQVNRGISSMVGMGLERLRTAAGARRRTISQRLLNLRGLSPRQQVYFFFLAMVRRGGEGGISRKASQTPYEYAQDVETAFPEIDEEVASLTAAYVEARYSQHTQGTDDVSRVKRQWQRIRQALRRKRE